MTKFEAFVNIVGHYKYLITIVLGVLFITVLTDYGIVNLVKLDMQKSDLQEEIDKYTKQAEDDENELHRLKTNPGAVERVARERYFMNREGEDVFVLSTDIPAKDETNGNRE